MTRWDERGSRRAEEVRKMELRYTCLSVLLNSRKYAIWLCSVLGLTVYYCTLRFLSLICSKYCKLCRGFNNSYTLKWSYFAYFLESDQIMSIYVQIIPMMQNLRLQTAEPRAVSTEAPPTHIERGSQSQERWVKWRAEEAKTV